MKNIHILPTDQPSRLYAKDGNYKLANSTMSMDWYISSVGYKPYNIYITSDEAIEEGVNQWYLDKFLNKPMNSGGAQYGEKQNVIILTTDPTLIEDGVQSIEDDFLKWFVKNSSCEFVVIDWSPLSKNLYGWKIIIPQEEPKQDFTEQYKELEDANLCEPLKSWEDDKQSTLEEAAENYSKGWGENDDEKSFISGGKWMEKRMFSKEEVRQIAEWSFHFYKTNEFDDSELEEEWYKLLDERLNKK
jgi:hypothetical protein